MGVKWNEDGSATVTAGGQTKTIPTLTLQELRRAILQDEPQPAQVSTFEFRKNWARRYVAEARKRHPDDAKQQKAALAHWIRVYFDIDDDPDNPSLETKQAYRIASQLIEEGDMPNFDEGTG